MSDEITGTTHDAGAVTSESLPAAEVSAEESTGAEAVTPESQSAAVESVEEKKEGEEAEKQRETAEAATEGKEDHKKTFEERLAEIKEEAKKEVFERIEAERAEKEKAAIEVPGELDYQKIKTDFARSYARENAIREEIALDPESSDPKLLDELFQIQEWRRQVTEGIKEHETKRAGILAEKEKEAQFTAYWQQQNARIEDTLKVIQTHENVPDALLQKGRDTWKLMCKEDPTLGRKFDEGILAGRLTETTQWAWNMAKERLAKASTEAVNKKEEGKDKQISGETGDENPTNIKSFDQLMKLPSSQINKFVREHPKAFETLKRQRFR